MPLVIGSHIGAYEIVAPLGAGGMGVVYRARDTRLGRDVAIKVLPEVFTSDADRLQRFEQEARVLASLNHPHIGAIYGFEEADGVRGLVLELVEGPTLADRLRTGPLPVPEALATARQIADALDAAHERGIIHRDLKPANIKVTPDGTAKVLDFGLAKGLAPDGSKGDVSNSPTITAVGTRAGVILGTAGYMSPEQARGKPSDKRTDIWSFGCVLYEMLTGRAAFGRDTVSDTLVAILDREPDWQALPAATPPAIRRLLQRCLERDPKRRLHDIADARIEIDDAMAQPVAAVAGKSRRTGLRIAIAVAALALIAAVTLVLIYMRRPVATDEALRFVVLPPEGASFGLGVIDRVPAFAISPDGRRLVFVATDRSGRTALWVRPIGSLSAEPLAGTEAASFPFWSPDSNHVGFFAQGKLKRVSLAGGAPVTLSDARPGVGGTWNRDGVIVFAAGEQNPLLRVSDAGGTATPVTALDPERQERGHVLPQFLPDGRHFLYLVRAERPAGIYVGSLDSRDTKRVLLTAVKGAYAPPGYLLFLRGEALMAQPFDVAAHELRGEPVQLVESVAFSSNNGRAAYSVSDTGVLAYRASGIPATSQLVWTDRSGKRLTPVGAVGDYQMSRISPDQSRVAAELHDLRTGTGDLWLLDLKRGMTSRFTFDGFHNNAPVWSPDGSRIVFAARQGGIANLHHKPASGSEADEPLLPPGPNRLPTDWSPDARHILFNEEHPKTRTDLWVLEMPDRKPVPYLQTEFVERFGRFSPDGRWVAYVSNESGRDQAYVRPFPASGGHTQISIDGGTQPQWRADGKELFYVASDDVVMSVPVSTIPKFEPGVPRALFKAQIRSDDYSVSADGERFLLNLDAPGPTAPPPPITTVINWTTALKK